MKKFIKGSYEAGTNGVVVAAGAQRLAKPPLDSCMNEEYGAGWDSKTMAYNAQDEGDLEEACLHYTLACEKFAAITASLRDQVFMTDRESGAEVLVEMTEQNTNVIFRYIEALTNLAEMQMRFASYEAAEPNIKEFLRLVKHTKDSTAGDLYNLAVIYKKRYDSDNNIKTLLESTVYFINSLIEYRQDDPEACEEVAEDIIGNIKLVALHHNNEKFAFDKLAKDEQRLLKRILAEVLNQEQLHSLASSGDEKHQFFVAKKWHYPLHAIEDISEGQFKKIQRLQRRLIPESQDDCEQEERQNNHLNSVKRPSRSKSSSPEQGQKQTEYPKQSTSAKKRTKIDSTTLNGTDKDLINSDDVQDSDKDADSIASSPLNLEFPQTNSKAPINDSTLRVSDNMNEKIDINAMTEIAKIALHDAFIEFAATYDRTPVKKQGYHLVNSDKELKRVMYVIPPDSCRTPEEIKQFVNHVIALLQSKNSSKHQAKNVESDHIVAKLPGTTGTKEFKDVKTSANTNLKETVKLVLDDKPAGTVAVAFKSAVYAYDHLQSDLNSVKKSKTASAVTAKRSPEPNVSSEQSKILKIKIKTSAASTVPSNPTEPKPPVEQPKTNKTRLKSVPVRTQASAPAAVKSAPRPDSASVQEVSQLKKTPHDSASSDHLSKDVFSAENSGDGSTIPQILKDDLQKPTKQPGSPTKISSGAVEKLSPDLKRGREEEALQVTAGLVDPATALPAEQPGDSKKSKGITPVPTEPDLIVKEEKAGSSYSNFLSLFGGDPEVQALLQEKKAEEERARLAAEAAEKARAEVAKLKPELKSVKHESAELLAKARQKLVDDLKKDVEAKKREREEKEKDQAEAEQLAKSKSLKLEEKRKKVEEYKQFESFDANSRSSFN